MKKGNEWKCVKCGRKPPGDTHIDMKLSWKDGFGISSGVQSNFSIPLCEECYKKLVNTVFDFIYVKEE